jgi:hypothetical protein
MLYVQSTCFGTNNHLNRQTKTIHPHFHHRKFVIDQQRENDGGHDQQLDAKRVVISARV